MSWTGVRFHLCDPSFPFNNVRELGKLTFSLRIILKHLQLFNALLKKVKADS